MAGGISGIEYLRRLQKLRPQIEQETTKLFLRSPAILKAKVDEFKRGENPEGGRIGYYSNPAYRLFKRSLNPLAGGTVDLILTGDFTRGLVLEQRGKDKFLFDSYDDKAPMLFDKYGQENRLLKQSTWDYLQKNEIAPQLTKWMKRQMGQ